MEIPGKWYKVVLEGLPYFGKIGQMISGECVTLRFPDGTEYTYGSNCVKEVSAPH